MISTWVQCRPVWTGLLIESTKRPFFPLFSFIGNWWVPLCQQDFRLVEMLTTSMMVSVDIGSSVVRSRGRSKTWISFIYMRSDGEQEEDRWSNTHSFAFVVLIEKSKGDKYVARKEFRQQSFWGLPGCVPRCGIFPRAREFGKSRWGTASFDFENI